MGSLSKVVVIGAGPAGLSAALRLADRGVDVEVLEAGPAVGGMAKTIDLWGQRVDLGPHRFFCKDPRVNALWLDLAGRDFVIVDRLTRILYRGKYFHYPLRPGNALLNLGPAEALRCTWSFARERIATIAGRRPDERRTFEDWVVSQFGRRLFEIFFKTYSEKLWGIPCADIDADFAAQRIQKLSLAEAILAPLRGAAGGRHRTLTDRFLYPSLGTGMIYERMAERVVRRGGRVRLRTPVRRVLLRGNAAVGVETGAGEIIPASAVVSSMPLPLLLKSLEGAPPEALAAASRLTYRNTALVYLEVEGAGIFPDNWLYVHSPELATGRITNFRNWSPAITRGSPNTILAMEYWLSDSDPRWTGSDGALEAQARSEIAKTGLIGSRRILRSCMKRVPRCYPVYRSGYRECLEAIRGYLDTVPNLMAIGRYGAFKYNNQDHSIVMGLLASDRLLGEGPGATTNLWTVNVDYDSYQESEPIAS